MKQYPTQVWLEVTNPKTGKPEMRWFPVNNEAHEKFVRSQIKSAKETIAKAREEMAKSIGAEPQRMIVEDLQKEFVEFHRRESHGRMDVRRGEAGEARGDQGQLHADSEPARPDSPRGSGSGQAQGRESREESVDGTGIRESSPEPQPIETT